MVVIESRPSLRVAAPRKLSVSRSGSAPRTLEAPPKVPGPRRSYPDGDLAEVVAAAVDGDPAAWTTLTQRFGNMVMAIARSCRLNDADVAEVHQMTWLRLVENIGRIEQRERIGAWLATTARRESLRIVRAKGRVAFDHEGLMERPDITTAPRTPVRSLTSAPKPCAGPSPSCHPTASDCWASSRATTRPPTRRSPSGSRCPSAASARPGVAAWSISGASWRRWAPTSDG